MGSVHVRQATVEDAAGIARVHVVSWQATYRGHMPDEVLDNLSVERRAADWRQHMPPGPGWALLVVIDDDTATSDDHRLAGFAHLRPCRDHDLPPATGEISAIYLHPSEWGHGWGRLLMDAALQRLTAEGYRRAVLWVLVDNQRARRFYEAGGWTSDGTTKTEDIGGAAITEMRYRRTLDPDAP
jgi:ribosomal protein S18 acetylase RimI-like enzyme